jgi:hypothetical protein
MADIPDAPPSVRVEVRCPNPVEKHGKCYMGKLFTVLYLNGDQPSYIQPDNLIEMYCLDCKRRYLAEGRLVSRVLHRYDFAGRLVDTLIEE